MALWLGSMCFSASRSGSYICWLSVNSNIKELSAVVIWPLLGPAISMYIPPDIHIVKNKSVFKNEVHTNLMLVKLS